MASIVVELQEALRGELKDPIGPVFTNSRELLAGAGEPLVTVGDVVTYHVIDAGETPDVALIDDRTERSAVDDEIADGIAEFDGFDREVTVDNPAATLSGALLEALRDALEVAPETTTLIEVDGEEDLAALPALLAVPIGGSVVYGQPGEGMVHVVVDKELQADIAGLISRMDGDPDRLFSILGVEPTN